jgi:hypothetical protein
LSEGEKKKTNPTFYQYNNNLEMLKKGTKCTFHAGKKCKKIIIIPTQKC